MDSNQNGMEIPVFLENPFVFAKKNILNGKHLGITGDIASVLTPPEKISTLKTLQACPFTNSAGNLWNNNGTYLTEKMPMRAAG